MEDDDLDAEIRSLAARRARAIVMREGAALALSARELDEPAIEADSQLLAMAIAQAIVDAYSGLLDDRDDEPEGSA
ncbi:hypothetical protein [Mesorhizobium sp. A556]